MRVLLVTAGAGGMYCGSCLRDNALAAELKARGHDVFLLPLYTPTRTDEPNVSDSRVFFGGVSVYLQQHVPFLRHTPDFIDRLWDSAAVIRAVSGRGVSTDPTLLGELTVSMLKGEDGFQAKEMRKLLRWLRAPATLRRHQPAQRAAAGPGAAAARGGLRSHRLHAHRRGPVPGRAARALSPAVARS